VRVTPTRGDTRVRSIKVIVMTKKPSVFFRKNRGDTLSCRPGWHRPWRHWSIHQGSGIIDHNSSFWNAVGYCLMTYSASIYTCVLRPTAACYGLRWLMLATTAYTTVRYWLPPWDAYLRGLSTFSTKRCNADASVKLL